MEKSHLCGHRGRRRWRSWTKWMRRLKTDWNDHWEGWPPKYEWKDGTLCYVSPGDPTQLCGCFDLADPQAIRFKDTPKPCSCVGCGNPRRWFHRRTKEALTLAEKVAGLRDDWSKRKRREGFHPYRVRCGRCGYLIRIVMVANGKPRSYARSRTEGKCPGCEQPVNW